MITVALMAIVVYLLLPLSAADQRLMASYEQLGSSNPKSDLTKAKVISQIGPPSRCDVPTKPNTCIDYIWVAHFDRPMCYQEFVKNPTTPVNPARRLPVLLPGRLILGLLAKEKIDVTCTVAIRGRACGYGPARA
jgi:hypothetical protein